MGVLHVFFQKNSSERTNCESLAWNKRSDPMSMAWFDEPNALLQVLRPFLILLHQSFATCCISTGVIEAGCRSVPKSAEKREPKQGTTVDESNQNQRIWILFQLVRDFVN